VTGTIVEYTLTYEYVNFSPLTQSFRSDVSDGNALPYIVLANLHEGDTIYDDPIFSPKVKGIATRSYAGSSRSVVYATYFGVHIIGINKRAYLLNRQPKFFL
jgi:hypothetical protein